MEIIQKAASAVEALRQQSPLIHCITNHITICDCANMLLAAGAKPIMAEHPAEVEEIVRTAGALEMNIGNISDSRMEAMLLAGKEARKQGIPRVFDPVGVGCSHLRLEFAKKLLQEVQPQILRGNMSELKALVGLKHDATGIDAGAKDAIDQQSWQESSQVVAQAARQLGCVVAVTGKIDIISDGQHTYGVENGAPWMSRVTGTGCMGASLTGGYLAVADPLTAALTANLVLGIAGEQATSWEKEGLGTQRVKLFDFVSLMEGDTLLAHAKVKIRT